MAWKRPLAIALDRQQYVASNIMQYSSASKKKTMYKQEIKNSQFTQYNVFTKVKIVNMEELLNQVNNLNKLYKLSFMCKTLHLKQSLKKKKQNASEST